MASYKTPGVYVEEISTLPPSVAGVATAVPAFVGYTKIGPEVGADPTVKRISSILEFMSTFGGASPATFVITKTNTSDDQSYTLAVNEKGPTNDKKFVLYYALSHYFKNGGGPCYVVSVGNYQATPEKGVLSKGIDALEKEDEPTLIVLTDAACLLSALDYYSLCSEALGQCKALSDRFTILDVAPSPPNNDKKDWENFRNDASLSINLNYGAAYTPYLQTNLNYVYSEDDVEIVTAGHSTSSNVKDDKPTDKGKGVTKAAKLTMASLLIKKGDVEPQTELHNQIKTILSEQRIVLPPSAAMAGIYARVDREQGVWKAPANVGVMAVIGPVSKITDADQEGLNIDATAGKSINAIRAFTGKGTLVWGARTLAGNDNEWRYVSVRRLFITIEESTRKASAFAVFEPNDQSSWLKVKAMIESYLYGLWEQGALAGAKPDAAYYVNVGLGTTMTPQDVLEGRMIVEIGIAAVRPAEFIILRFSHKLQTA
jgi:phage tail sheath protein FI